MVAINARRVVLAGLAAGAVRLAGEGALRSLVLGPVVQPEFDRLRPVLLADPTRPAGVAATIAIQLALGLLVVFLYAAMRPRFGPGARTAVWAALTQWAIAALVNFNMGVIGLFSWHALVVRVVATLVPALAAGAVGAWLYREADATATAARYSATTV